MTVAPEAPARPPRPARIDPEILTEAARRLGAKRTEIVDVVDTDAGRIVTTRDGHRSIIVPADRPDGLGQSGVLAVDDGRPLPKGVAVYCDPATARQRRDAGEAWTVADLDIEAARLHVPAATYDGPAGPSRRAWIGADPIRARAVWRKIAAGLDATPAVAVHRSTEAAHCRAVITASGWLSASEAAAL